MSIFTYAICLLFCCIAVTTTRSLEEGLKAVQAIDGNVVSPDNVNKLIHFTGDVMGEVVGDEKLGVAIAGAKLERHVEVFSGFSFSPLAHRQPF
jgi:hypothetical protein